MHRRIVPGQGITTVFVGWTLTPLPSVRQSTQRRYIERAAVVGLSVETLRGIRQRRLTLID